MEKILDLDDIVVKYNRKQKGEEWSLKYNGGLYKSGDVLNWKKKADQWQDLDMNNIPSDLFTSWDIEEQQVCIGVETWVRATGVSQNFNYRIKRKEKTLYEKAAEYAEKQMSGVSESCQVCLGINIKAAYIEGAKSCE